MAKKNTTSDLENVLQISIFFKKEDVLQGVQFLLVHEILAAWTPEPPGA